MSDVYLCVFASVHVRACVFPSQTYVCTPAHLSASACVSVFSFLCECGSSAQVERRESMRGIQRTQLLRMTSWQFKKQFLQSGGALCGLAFRTSTVLFSDGECVHVKMFLVKAGFPLSLGSFPGRPRTHNDTSVCFGWFDLEWAAGCWFKYEWTWLQNVANSITEGGKWTEEWRNPGWLSILLSIWTHTQVVFYTKLKLWRHV